MYSGACRAGSGAAVSQQEVRLERSVMMTAVGDDLGVRVSIQCTKVNRLSDNNPL